MSNSNTRPEMERITTPELAEAFIDEQLKALREQIGTGKVLLAQNRCGDPAWRLS